MTTKMKKRRFHDKVVKRKRGSVNCQVDIGSWKWFIAADACIK